MITNILHGLWQYSIPRPAADGQTVTYSAPTGCALCVQYGGAGEWVVVNTPSGFTHSGGPAVYKVVGTTDAASVVTLSVD